MAREIKSAINPNTAQAPAAVTASANTTGLDCSGYEEVVYLLAVGAVTGTSPTLDAKVQESATQGGTYTDIAGAAFAQITNANHALHLNARVTPAKPFQRVVLTLGGTTPSFTMAMMQLRCNPPLLPAAAGS